ncbi:type II methionyl aminopeptidase [Candidatus Pacearchaeota archaeon]|nr:type II methionyl aminopeptidase [Candidatus Pacearchaeota archaeon]
MDNKEILNLEKAGKIASQTVKYARNFIKRDMFLLNIAEEIEDKIIQLGGSPAFPINLSINEVAAHSTPAYNDSAKAHGLLKIDIGVHINGYIADTAFSLDLDNLEENKKLINAAEAALLSAVELVKEKKIVKVREIGAVISKTIEKYGLQAVRNLSGHSIEKNEIHAGITIPNYDNAQEKILEKGIYAIEPFVTNGVGTVRDGKPSGIYALTKEGNVRDQFAREVLTYIKENYLTRPFCSRWLYKKFGSRALIALKRIEESGLLHNYPQLIESSGKPVAQAEHTIAITSKDVIILTDIIDSLNIYK